MPKIKEPTLPFDWPTLRKNVGFRSPWMVRLRLWFLGIRGEVRPLRFYSDHIFVQGWINLSSNATYITHVTKTL